MRKTFLLSVIIFGAKSISAQLFHFGENGFVNKIVVTEAYEVDTLFKFDMLVTEDQRSYCIQAPYKNASSDELRTYSYWGNIPQFTAEESGTECFMDDNGDDLLYYFDYDKDGVKEAIHYMPSSGEFLEVTRSGYNEDGATYQYLSIGKSRSVYWMQTCLIGSKLAYYTESAEIGYFEYVDGKWINVHVKPGRRHHYYPVTVADANKDGYPEFYCSDYEGNLNIVDFMNGKPKSTKINVSELTEGIDDIYDVYYVYGEFANMDEDPELEYLYLFENRIILCDFDGKEVASNKVIISDTLYNDFFTVVNIDKDEKAEIISYGRGFAIYDFQSNNYEQKAVQPQVDMSSIFLGDLNNDGYEDILVNGTSRSYIVWGNDLEKMVDIDHLSLVYDVVAVDMDSDNLLDLLFLEDYGGGYWLSQKDDFQETYVFDLDNPLPILKKDLWK